MKTCSACLSDRPESDFYLSHGKPYHACKECIKSSVRKRRGENLESVRAYDRLRCRTPERKAKSLRDYHRKKIEIPGYGRAHSAVANAIKAGRLVNPGVCERCLSVVKTAAHHDDHSMPLAIQWLCGVCHSARHMELAKTRATA